ncbi:DUF1499 domain-containing protein [Marinomonas sp. A3A]|jgi:uncharacterized protein (DUF1499 family)|uniref:DUF1499 domain-containing protein n=1 Tax=Marinomonas TaxID=28253 RepID=UPI001BB304CB|nr:MULTISPECIES: DUF1499 domain-containing protein [Marinomonas]QUX92769.1 DUF1499 domain-containing protein [Marinomonas sp. A3A]
MVRWIIALIVVLFVGFFIYVNMSNKLPEGLGVTDGELMPCPSTPNCVSTQASPEDLDHYAEPVVYTGDRMKTQLSIESFMLNKGNTHLVSSTLGYVHFEVKSPLVGYIDDVEFYLPAADSVVHIRSASRVGYSDFGVNRERVRQIQSLLVD